MTNRVTLSDLDNQLTHLSRYIALPDSCMWARGGAYNMESFQVRERQGGGVIKEWFGTKREVLGYMRSEARDMANRAWGHTIAQAQRDGTKIINGGGWSVRFTPKFIFVRFDDGNPKTVVSRRLPANTNHWEVARIISPD